MQNEQKPNHHSNALTPIPWKHLIKWIVIGALALPFLVFMFWAMLYLCLHLYEDGSVLTGFEQITSGYGTHYTFEKITGLPWQAFENLLIACVFPGAILGCILYLFYRKRQLGLIRHKNT